MPSAEHVIDEPLVRALLRGLPAPLAHVRDLPLAFVAEGWDNSVWRVGHDLAARVARRSLAAPGLENEARWAAVAAAPLVERGVPVTLPVHLTPGGGLHPLPWLLTTWVEGTLVDDVPVADRGPAARRLAGVLPRLHRPAPPGAPHNPFRATPISDLPAPAPDVVERARGVLGDVATTGLLEVLAHAGRAPRWPGPARWVHGDLHPLNLVVGPAGLGVLDLGDVTAGDPAVDLGVLWTSFDAAQRSDATARLAPHYDDHVGDRARGWAARLLLGVAGNDAARFAGTLSHAVPQVLDSSS